MVRKRTLDPTPAFDHGLLTKYLAENSIKELHAIALWEQLLPDLISANPPVSFERVRDRHALPRKGVPVALKRLLVEDSTFTPLSSEVDDVQQAGSTTKLLVRLQDGKMVESVIIYNKGYNTLCVSSQVGCRMACTFCATGTMGLLGNMTSGEIVEQLIHARRVADIRNIVFMGMGEPLDNYKEVLAAVRMFTDPRIFALFPRHITVSTVGIVPRMVQMGKDMPDVNLALSLHAPTQEKRLKIVPTAKSYAISTIMGALDDHLARSKKTRVMVECIVIKDVNDSMETAHEFGKLFTETENRREKLIINFIPYNPTLVEADFEAPTHERVREIQTLLINEYGCHVRIRKEMGQENQAACGQLALKKGPCDKGSKIVDDIEDLTNSSQKKKPKPSTRSRSRRGRPSENTLFSRDLPIIFAVLAALIYYLLSYKYKIM
eukprot:405946_1